MPIFSGGGGGGGGSIASITVLTGSGNGTDYSSTSTSWADVDDTNLKSSALLVPVGKKAYIQAWFVVQTSSNIGIQVGISIDSAAPAANGIAEIYSGANGFAMSGSLLEVLTGDGSTHTFALAWLLGGAGTFKMINSKGGFAPAGSVVVAPRMMITIA